MNTLLQEPPRYVQATFKDRLLAAFLDLAIVATLSFPISVVVGIADLLYRRMQNDVVPQIYDNAMLFFNTAYGLLVSFLYVGYFYKHRGTTLGKSIMNLKVICLPYAEKPTYKTAALRDLFGKFVSIALFFIGYLMVLFRKDGRALHDLVADTLVVKKL